MINRTTITVNDECWEFLNKVAGDNRSAYINKILDDVRRQHLEQEAIQANIEEAQDTDCIISRKEWEVTLLDGLPDE